MLFFVDDFNTAEPSFARESGQRFLQRLMELQGYPDSVEKRQPMAASAVFLAVITDFSRFRDHRVVSLSVSAVRAQEIRYDLAQALETDSMPQQEARRLAGRLGFATTWAAFRFGRAALQPFFARAARMSGFGNHDAKLDAPLRQAVEFFVDVLQEVGGLPAREYVLSREQRPTVQVWSDAAAEPASGEPGRLGFVVRFPPEFVNGRLEPERFVHASAPVPHAFAARFELRRQYIGQYELLAAVAVYRSLAPELAGRRVVHFVDNTSALAGLAAGLGTHHARFPRVQCGSPRCGLV